MKKEAVKTAAVTVRSFLDEGGHDLEMELIAGDSGLRRVIGEATINRPGLALCGFFEHFAHRRVQVLGMAEQAYLASLDPTSREHRLREFFRSSIPCLVITRNRKINQDCKALADEMGVPVLRTRMITKRFVNAATILMENLMAPRSTVQGTMVEILGIGVLITGKAGVGKSEIALGLLRRGHALVSDDVTALRLDSSGAVFGSPMSVTRYHLEIRGLGIIHVPSLFGVASVREEKKLDLVVTLTDLRTVEELEDRLGLRRRTREVLGVNIPEVLLPVAPGRDLTNVVETAALDERLRRLGHDAAKELDEKLMSLMKGARDGGE